MRRSLRTGITLLGLVAGLAVSGITGAALLGIDSQISLPIVQFDGGTTIIAGGTLSATVNNGFMAIVPVVGVPQLITDNSLAINVVVDNACNLVGGVSGSDFELSGTIDGGPSGLLLTGEVLESGFTESGVVQFDFRFAVTGGALVGDFVDEDLGVVVTSLNSDFLADCSVMSGGGAKGRLGAIPPIQPAQGCTPGYWKQKHHFDSWDATPYSPGQTVVSVFGSVDGGGIDNTTLANALKLKGGGLNALVRHATAALLNASHPDVNSTFTTAEVIAAVQAAVNGGDIEATKDAFEEANEEGCPLN